jgi:hypothetical protein
MSVGHVPAATDTERVIRYLNPAYEPGAYASAIDTWFAAHDVLVTITHPHELMPAARAHPLLPRRIDALARNLDAIARAAPLRDRSAEFVTVSELAARWIPAGEPVPAR